MFDWVSRETLLDVSINAIPALILAYFVALILVRSPWRGPPLVDSLTGLLTVFPLAVLVVASYLAARAIQRDTDRSRGD